MEAMHLYLNALCNKNKQDFADFKDINWLNAYNGEALLARRDLLLEEASESMLFKDTKPYYNHISQGCKMCGFGYWSCLFITNICNGKCFYCPTSQVSDDKPSSQGMTFDTASAYADYINHFKFKGVGFSGGEPLLVFDRTLEYLKKVRKNCSPDIYIWMYTNGILADEIKIKKLAAAGLNEIRFDIGATDFSLDKVILAKGLIENITIEIPSVPEELERMKSLLPAMIKAGVTNLNLHQLRLTTYNAKHLLKRAYTYVPDERPIVLESEIAALELIKYAKEKNLHIGINYCSFHYKNRFQKAGFRNQISAVLSADDEKISPNGYIRSFGYNKIKYETIRISDFTDESKETLSLAKKKYNISRESAMNEIILSDEQNSLVQDLISNASPEIPKDGLLFELWGKEHIESKLRNY